MKELLTPAHAAAPVVTLDALRAMRGTVMIVRSGRKVPLGTLGVLVTATEGDYGPRCGLFLPVGTWAWTSTTNVTPYTPTTAGEREEVEDLRIAWAVAEERREATKAALLPGQPRLKGSPRQVSWALQIREKLLMARVVTPDEARAILSAKVWIDRRFDRRPAPAPAVLECASDYEVAGWP